MSPYTRKVMVLLYETGQLADVTLVSTHTSPFAQSESLSARNPLAKLPALECDDGRTLYDSRVICAYLDEKAGNKLYSSDAQRWDTLTLEAMGDGILDAALLITYEARLRPEGKRSDDWTNAQWCRIAGACAALDTRWAEHLMGPMDMGQIGVACALGYLDIRHGTRGWRQGNDALSNWYATFKERPSMKATEPPAN